jgi:quercetin dioxygenase-like cupin family protein
MRLLFALATSLAAIASITAFPQEPQLAPEGRGLLPRAAGIPATLGSTPPPHAFEPDPSGGFSRTIFETDEHPDFKLVIRDFSFPPDRRPHTVTLPSSAFLHLLSGPGEIGIAKQRLTLTPVARTAVPAGAPIDVLNSGEQPVVVRALILEAK